jgi:hypothetical protein
MRVLTINELMRLTRTELCALAARITAELPTFREAHRSARPLASTYATSASSSRDATSRPSRAMSLPACVGRDRRRRPLSCRRRGARRPRRC